jgi:hypothetical protein
MLRVDIVPRRQSLHRGFKFLPLAVSQRGHTRAGAVAGKIEEEDVKLTVLQRSHQRQNVATLREIAVA